MPSYRELFLYEQIIRHIPQEKDLAVSGITINAERSTVVDFTYPFWLESSAAVMHVSFL